MNELRSIYIGDRASQVAHLQRGRPGFHHWVGKSPWRRVCQPTPVLLPGESPWTEEPGGLHGVAKGQT